MNPVSLGLNRLVEYQKISIHNKLTAVGETQMTQGVDIYMYYEKQWAKY
jgi:hypothetical protein